MLGAGVALVFVRAVRAPSRCARREDVNADVLGARREDVHADLVDDDRSGFLFLLVATHKERNLRRSRHDERGLLRWPGHDEAEMVPPDDGILPACNDGVVDLSNGVRATNDFRGSNLLLRRGSVDLLQRGFDARRFVGTLFRTCDAANANAHREDEKRKPRTNHDSTFCRMNCCGSRSSIDRFGISNAEQLVKVYSFFSGVSIDRTQGQGVRD